MIRATLFALLAVAAGGCTKICRDGTLLVTVSTTALLAAGDTLVVDVQIDRQTDEKSIPITSANASGSTVEIDFGTSYSPGRSASITLTQTRAGVSVASGTETVTLGSSCEAISLALRPIVSDAGSDGSFFDGSSDGSAADMMPAVATARLIAPLSTSTVTQQKPTLSWVLGPGPGTPAVDLCKDRACTMPVLGVSATIAAGNTSATPTAALPAGWVFWRVRVVLGGQTTTSATWQLWVGKTSASTPIDSSSGTILDVNGDGFADFLIGAPHENPITQSGAAFLYLGNGSGTAFPRSDINGGTNSKLGGSVASAGDVNGDGFADFLVGELGGNAAHLYFGTASGTAPQPIDLVPPGGGGAGFGISVAGAGDVNGDGFADFLIGENVTASSQAGAAHLYLGGPLPSTTDWNGASPAKRVDLTSPDGASTNFGISVATAGDVNGDGLADFLVGANQASSNSGAAHLYLGMALPSTSDWNGTSPAKRIDLLNPDGANAGFGFSVAGAGDINGDGFMDFLVGAPGASAAVGAANVYLGEALPSTSDWNGTSPAKRIDLTSPDTSGHFGNSVAGGGDLDGDGFADFLVGRHATGLQGAANVYLGKAPPSATDWNGASPAKRIDLVSPDGSGANFGFSVASAGDVNGDGFADFLVGAPDPTSSSSIGAAHLYLGEALPSATDWNGASPAKRIDLTDDGANVQYGYSVASANDGIGTSGVGIGYSSAAAGNMDKKHLATELLRLSRQTYDRGAGVCHRRHCRAEGVRFGAKSARFCSSCAHSFRRPRTTGSSPFREAARGDVPVGERRGAPAYAPEGERKTDDAPGCLVADARAHAR